MKISLKLIAQEIQQGEVHIAATRKWEPDTLRLDHLMLWKKTEFPDPSVCYIVNASQITPGTSFHAGGAYIILGQCNEDLFQNLDADVLIWKLNRKEDSFTEQFNTICSIFHYYHQADQQMKLNLINNGSLQELISKGETLFHNMILLLDGSFCLLSETRKNNPLEWEKSGYPQQYTLPGEIIEQIRLNPEFRTRTLNNGIFSISNDILNCNALFMQIQREHLSFYIVLLETERKISSAHQQLLISYSEYIYQSLRNRRFSSNRTIQFEYFVERMLDNEKIEPSEVLRQLQTQQWKLNDQYVCYILDLDLWNPNDVDPHTICRMEEKRFPGSFCFYHEDKIICIINLTQTQMSRELFLQLLAPFVRDNLFHVGISYEFSDFSTLTNYYQQALASIEFGKRYHPDEWIYRFEKYVLHYFTMYGISKMEPRHLCHPDLILLEQYDEQNNTELLNTLKTYLMCGLNATETASELFIHRNTLYQRISKIEQIIQASLSQPDTRLYMQLSFSFMEFSSL